MTRTAANSARANRALALVEDLQRQLRAGLEGAIPGSSFSPVQWLRDDGRHGGGERWVVEPGRGFNRASLNVSQVHYDDEPTKRLGSATALSSIVHPANPQAPSLHTHISWTEMRDGTGYWRVMADLNPSNEQPAATAAFKEAIAGAAGDTWAHGSAQGDRYFDIPALQRHRGVCHYYLEGYATEDDALPRRVGEATIAIYARLLAEGNAREATAEDRERQLAYHTVYLFQVLTLDRGTTSGLLVHDQNDVGILGSLPAQVDRDLLRSWAAKAPAPQDALVRGIVDALPDETPSPVTEDGKRALAALIRRHYKAHPEALALQASGDVIPPTVANHS